MLTSLLWATIMFAGGLGEGGGSCHHMEYVFIGVHWGERDEKSSGFTVDFHDEKNVQCRFM